MSLAETQVLVQAIQELIALLDKVEVKTEKLQADAPRNAEALFTLQQVFRVASRLSGKLESMGVSKDAQKAVAVFNELARAATMAYFASNLIMMGTPYGLIMGLMGMVTMGANMGDLAMNIGE